MSPPAGFSEIETLSDHGQSQAFPRFYGRRMQSGNTRTMIFGCAKLVSYVSQFMTLMPGDVITTGTPPGVGLGMKPPLYLKKGDVMTLGIEGLGAQRQLVVPFSL